MAGMPGVPWAWGVTKAEWERRHRCDDAAQPDWLRMARGVDVEAPPERVWPWLCQLRVAPYSYDWVDNWGRRSPRTLTPALTDLRLGQDFMTIFRLEDFVASEQLTLSMKPGGPQRVFGAGWVTYAVTPASAGSSRLVAVLAFERRGGPLGRASNALLPWGDLLMMRHQLHTFARLAERTPTPGVG